MAPAEVEPRRVRGVVAEEARIERVDYKTAVFAIFDQTRFAEYAEVVGHVDDFVVDETRNFGDVPRPASQQIDDLNAGRLAERLQEIRAGLGQVEVDHG